MAKLNASRNPTFSTEMEAMERTTPGHYSEWNKRHQQLLDNDQYLNRGIMYHPLHPRMQGIDQKEKEDMVWQ